MIIAYQGIPGSYSYICAQKYFTKNNDFTGTDKFPDIFDMVEKGKADYGVIPVENSLAGEVYENYDLLAKHNIQVVGEYYLKIEHCLLGIQNDLKKIKKIYSHQKALEQCLKLFEKYPGITKHIYSDTASAAKYVAEKKDESSAAIASSDAAKLYKLTIIEKNIEDNPSNYTRFLIISRNKKTVENANKCSLIFKLPHIPGSLYNVLKIFASNNLNLTKIESRPIHGSPFEYVFHIDLEFNNQEINKVKKILQDFKMKVIELKILGFFKSNHGDIRQ